MSVKNDYDRFIAEQKEVMKKELIQFAMLDQEKRYVEPFGFSEMSIMHAIPGVVLM